MSAWEEHDQRVIDTAVRQWQTRLHACLKAKCGYFEQSLLELTLINTHMLCLCAFEALSYIRCKLPSVSIKCSKCVSLHKVTWYNVSILKVFWVMFPAFNVENFKATVAKVS